MKIAILQAGNTGFFPRYYKAIAQAVEKSGDNIELFVPNTGRNKRNVLPRQHTFGTRLNGFIHYYLYKISGVQDVFSFFATKHLIYKLNKYKPQVIHFNVINDKIINIPLLVRYVNKNKMDVVWTMHDCRAFTGQCPYFDEVGCQRWKTGCGKCPQCETIIDRTNITWNIRCKWHTGIKRLIIVTPSQWLASFVRQSFFKDCQVRVIYNGVDIDRFSRKVDVDVRAKYNIPQEKKIILGCSIFWERRKGLAYFERLATMLPDGYQIVLVGNIAENRRQDLAKKNIICTGQTKSFDEMVAWYQDAAVFCNPTMADNFPTTNIEALASGTPVVTFNTGGSPEAVNEKTGVVVEQGNIEKLCTAVIKVAEHRDIYTHEACIKRSRSFSNSQYDLYVQLYKTIMQKNA